MKLIVITPEKTVKGETEIINNLFITGLQRLHIRKPLFTTADYKNYIAALDSKYHRHIVLHGSFELYHEFGLGGIHLNSAIRDQNAVPDVVKDLSPAVVSASFHSWREIEDNEFHYGYVFISPVFDSISKKGYKAGIDLTGALDTKQKLAVSNKYCPQIIGLGGVGKQQIPVLRQCGFDGAAILGALWQPEN